MMPKGRRRTLDLSRWGDEVRDRLQYRLKYIDEPFNERFAVGIGAERWVHFKNGIVVA